MVAPKFGWFDKILILARARSSRSTQLRILQTYSKRTPEQKKELDRRIALSCNAQALSEIPSELVNFLFSPQAMLAHPLLVPFIRPATRLARANGYDIVGIPIITSPVLTFGGQAEQLDSGLKVAEIPLGFIFLLREIGRGILNLHHAIQCEETDKAESFADVCSQLSKLIYRPAAEAFNLGQNHFGKTSFSYKLFATHVSHVLGVFTILHEVCHICKNHNLKPWSHEQIQEQEFDADIFAVECIFSSKKDSKMYDQWRNQMLIYVCDLFSLMEVELNVSGGELNGYPSFDARRINLLDNFKANEQVRTAVDKFHKALA